MWFFRKTHTQEQEQKTNKKKVFFGSLSSLSFWPTKKNAGKKNLRFLQCPHHYGKKKTNRKKKLGCVCVRCVCLHLSLKKKRPGKNTGKDDGVCACVVCCVRVCLHTLSLKKRERKKLKDGLCSVVCLCSCGGSTRKWLFSLSLGSSVFFLN